MNSSTRFLWPLAALALTTLPVAAADLDIPPTVVLGGGTNSDNYTLTANGQVQGSGTFVGTFNAQTHDLSVNTLTGDLFFNGAISGTASSPLPNLTVTASSHTVHLNAANSFTGDLLLQSGTLKLGNAGALGVGSGQFRTTLGAAVLDLNGQAIASEDADIGAPTTFRNSSATPASWGGSIQISSSLLTFDSAAGDLAVTGTIYGGGVIKTGANILTVSGDNSGLTAGWDLVAGTLKFGHTNAVGLGVLVNGGGTTVDLGGQNLSSAALQAGTNSFTLANSELTAAAWNGNITTSGGSTVTLAATGDLQVNGAILQSSGTTSLAISGPGITVLASSSNNFTGDVTVGGASTLELTSGAHLNFVIGTDGLNNRVTGSGMVQLDGIFIFDLSGAGTTLGDAWEVVDVGNLAAYSYSGTFEVFGFTEIDPSTWQRDHFGTTYRFREDTGVLTVIPEPSTVALLLAAGGVLLVVGRRRRR